MKDEIKSLKTAIDDGIQGKSVWVPIGFSKMGESVGIGQRIYTIIGGMSGTGKTVFTDLAYVLQPYSWMKGNGEENNIQVRWLYFSMEKANKSIRQTGWFISVRRSNCYRCIWSSKRHGSPFAKNL